jgi:hypothetical protein
MVKRFPIARITIPVKPSRGGQELRGKVPNREDEEETREGETGRRRGREGETRDEEETTEARGERRGGDEGGERRSRIGNEKTPIGNARIHIKSYPPEPTTI